MKLYTIYTHCIRNKKVNIIVFRLNSDDYSKAHIKDITKHIKSLGYGLRKSVSHSTTKLMSWTTFRVITDHNYISWEENDILAKQIIIDSL